MRDHMNRFTFFDLIPAMPQHDLQRIQWAYTLAKRAHEGQERDGGERYFEHVRGVASILINHGYTEADFQILGLLHDILEDSFCPVSMLEQLFGPVIAREILSVSKSYGLEDPLTGKMTRSEKRSKEEYFASIARNGRRPALAKCADRIDNQSDLIDVPEGSRWTPAKRLSYIAETREWILPLADTHEPRFAERLRHQCDLIEAKVTSLIAKPLP